MNATKAASTSATAVSSAASQTESSIMTLAEQEALLLNKAILLSRLLQSQCNPTARQLFPASAGTTATLMSGIGNGLPTAVVAPIKRQTTELEQITTAATVANIANFPTLTAANVTSFSAPATLSSSQPQQVEPSSLQFPASTGKAHLPPIETFRAYHSALVGALSRNEAAQAEVNTSSFGAGAVNLSLHASASNTPAGS
jgi:hypothetical protein